MAAKQAMPRPAAVPSAVALALAAVFGLGYLLWHSGLTPLRPTQVDWLLRHDWSQHYLGWSYFRRSPLGWPIGALPQVAEPMGASVALMDANPLWSLLLWPLAAHLPAHFQFLGLYLASNFVLQAAVGVFLAARLGLGAINQALVALLLVAMPVLLHRLPHDTLTAHWLLLLILMTFWPAASEGARRRDGLLLAVSQGVAALTHPYLLVLALPLAWTSALARLGRARWREGMPVVGGALAGSVFAAAAFDALGLLDEAAYGPSSGFGYFSANLLALVDSSGWSRMIPRLPAAHPGQAFEGFNYLGAGGLLLLASALLVGRMLPGPRSAEGKPIGGDGSADGELVWQPAVRPLLVITAALFVAALSDRVFCGRYLLANWSALYDWLGPASQQLRCTGRFGWPLGYACLLVAIKALRQRLSDQALTSLLLAALIVQVAEVHHDRVAQQFHAPEVEPLRDSIWQLARADYRHIALLPPVFPGSDVSCGFSYPEKFEVPLSLFASESGMGINSAYLSHFRRAEVAAACRNGVELLDQGPFAEDTLYVMPAVVHAERNKSPLPLHCAGVDRYLVCVAQHGPKTAFAQALLARSSPAKKRH